MDCCRIFCTVVLLGLTCVMADDENRARILASKHVLNKYMVEKKDLTLHYNLYNAGDGAATSVELKDENFPEQYFENVRGALSVRWARVAPGANVTHVVVLRPLSAGLFNFTAAQISYRASEEDKEIQFGYTTMPGEQPIYGLKEYEKQFSSHLVDWLSFGLMTTPSLLIPFLLWHRSKSKYEGISSRSKKAN